VVEGEDGGGEVSGELSAAVARRVPPAATRQQGYTQTQSSNNCGDVMARWNHNTRTFETK